MKRMLLLTCACAAFLLASSCGSEEPASVDPGAGETDATFRVAVIGDFGRKTEAEEEVSEMIEAWHSEHPLHAIVTVGDNVYPYGAREFFEYSWSKPYAWVDDVGLDVWAALGNHDVSADDGASVMEFFSMPHRYYSKIIGDLEIFILDGTEPDGTAQLSWLRSALTRSSARWRIAVTHFPPYSCSRSGPDGSVLENFDPILREGDVQLVLSGHEHNYQRFQVDGVDYVVAGGGGDVLYDTGDCPDGYAIRLADNGEDYHFLVVEGDRKELRVTAVTADGATIDAFTRSWRDR